MEDLDRLLADGDSIEPSTGFAAGVMEALRQERPPIPFPWRRLAAGLAAAVALAATGAVLLSRAHLPWTYLPLGIPVLSRALPTLVMAALAALLGRGISRLPRAFRGD